MDMHWTCQRQFPMVSTKPNTRNLQIFINISNLQSPKLKFLKFYKDQKNYCNSSMVFSKTAALYILIGQSHEKLKNLNQKLLAMFKIELRPSSKNIDLEPFWAFNFSIRATLNFCTGSGAEKWLSISST